jgi:hypothetical protein
LRYAREFTTLEKEEEKTCLLPLNRFFLLSIKRQHLKTKQQIGVLLCSTDQIRSSQLTGRRRYTNFSTLLLLKSSYSLKEQQTKHWRYHPYFPLFYGSLSI